MMGKLGERWEREREGENERGREGGWQPPSVVCNAIYTINFRSYFLPHSLLLYVFLFFLIFSSPPAVFPSFLSSSLFLPDFFVVLFRSSSLLSSLLIPSPLHPIIVEENSLLVVMTVTSSVCDPNCHDHALNGMKGRKEKVQKTMGSWWDDADDLSFFFFFLPFFSSSSPPSVSNRKWRKEYVFENEEKDSLQRRERNEVVPSSWVWIHISKITVWC